jgi:hypothetical protein
VPFRSNIMDASDKWEASREAEVTYCKTEGCLLFAVVPQRKEPWCSHTSNS